MSSEKLINEWGVLVDVESVYGDGGTLTAADDGVLVLEQPVVSPEYAHDGARRGERGPMALGIKRVGKSGLTGAVSLVTEPAGAGAAYAAAVFPNIHKLLLLAGLDDTLDVTGSAESYTYIPGAGDSGGLEIYTREQKYILAGAYTDLVIAAAGPEIPVAEFAVQGLLTKPTDSAVPAITYPSVDPPKAEAMVVDIGDFLAAVVRSFTFSLNRSISPRMNQNAAGGHAGFVYGFGVPTLELEIEATDLQTTPFHKVAGLDPYVLAENATPLDLTLTVGSTQYNQYTIDANQAQLNAPIDDGEDGAAAIWTLSFDLLPSTPALKDNFSIVFD